MKKWIGMLLALCLLAAAWGACAGDEKETLVYASDFSKGADGWAGRSAQVSVTADGTLRTEGRTADWNSPGRFFEIAADNEYRISVEVYQDEADSAGFIVSLEKTDINGTGWENMIRGTVKKGEWTTLSGSYTFGDYDSYLLYVETSGAPSLSYEIRNFRLESPDGIPEPREKAQEAEAVVPEAENIPSLKEAYAGRFDFGAAVPGYAFANAGLTKLMKEQFSILTPENELKPDSVLDVTGSKKLAAEDETAVAIRLNNARPLLSFAQENGLKVHGHVLVWHSQTPEAFFHEGYDPRKPLVSREVMLGRLENYIREVLTQTEEQYPGVIVSWDVVNEAIDDTTKWMRSAGQSGWIRVFGNEEFILRAFEYARRYAAEGVLLYYNDYSTADSGKLAGITRLLNQLIPEGNIDGYGFQMHHSLSWPGNGQMEKAVEKIAGLGLKLRVSELDVGIAKYTDETLQKQADKYRAMMEIMLRFADQTEAVQVWGIRDDMSWRQSTPEKNPLLFDKNMNPKPAFYAVIEAAQGR